MIPGFTSWKLKVAEIQSCFNTAPSEFDRMDLGDLLQWHSIAQAKMDAEERAHEKAKARRGK